MEEEGKSIEQIMKELNLSRKQITDALYYGKTQASGPKEGFEEKIPRLRIEADEYVIHTGGYNKREIRIRKEDFKRLKQLYCGPSQMTINQICREMNIPRRDFFPIKTAFSLTHDDVPYDDEDLITRDADELALHTIEQLKKNYQTRFDQLRIDQMTKKLIECEKKEYFYEIIHNMIIDDLDTFLNGHEKPTIDLTLCSKHAGNPLMLEVPIVDLHLGKLAWKPESGENYDYKIADKRFSAVTDDVISRVFDRNFEKILYPIGQDFFHFDTINTTTTAGTPLDSDLRWQKLFVKGMEMLVKSIDSFAQIAPVHVLLVPGNHDRMTAFYAICFLQAWYRNVDHVTVDTDPKTRKYIEFGKNLIGYTHGDKEGRRIFGNMQVESPSAWGRTKYREWHTGHLHSEVVKEEHGVIVRRLSSVTGPDAWHFESGYVGAIAKHQSFIWDKQRGLSEILITIVE